MALLLLLANLDFAGGTESTPPELAPSDLAVVFDGSTAALTWSDTVSDNTGYSVQRKDGSADFAEIDTVGADIGTYDDIGPFAATVVYGYRIEVVGGAIDGSHSNEVYVGGGGGMTPVLVDEMSEVFRHFAWGT